jgi:hypothetical protein
MIGPLDSLPVLFAVFWKSGVALGAALGVNRVLRNQSADLRRLVLSTAIAAMFVAAAGFPLLPRWTAVTPHWFLLHRPAAQPVSARMSGPGILDNVDFTAPSIQSLPVKPVARRIDFRPWLISFLWIAGAATLLVRFAINLRALRCLRKASEPVTDAVVLAGMARFGRRVRLQKNAAIGAPVTWGIVRPIILVPAGFEQLPAECRNAVLCHEMAHIEAHDFWMRGLAEIARALIWFQPLMWIVWRQLREEQ